jgi:hypothetical protein
LLRVSSWKPKQSKLPQNPILLAEVIKASSKSDIVGVGFNASRNPILLSPESKLTHSALFAAEAMKTSSKSEGGAGIGRHLLNVI